MTFLESLQEIADYATFKPQIGKLLAGLQSYGIFLDLDDEDGESGILDPFASAITKSQTAETAILILHKLQTFLIATAPEVNEQAVNTIRAINEVDAVDYIPLFRLGEDTKEANFDLTGLEDISINAEYFVENKLFFCDSFGVDSPRIYIWKQHLRHNVQEYYDIFANSWGNEELNLTYEEIFAETNRRAGLGDAKEDRGHYTLTPIEEALDFELLTATLKEVTYTLTVISKFIELSATQTPMAFTQYYLDKHGFDDYLENYLLTPFSSEAECLLTAVLMADQPSIIKCYHTDLKRLELVSSRFKEIAAEFEPQVESSETITEDAASQETVKPCLLTDEFELEIPEHTCTKILGKLDQNVRAYANKNFRSTRSPNIWTKPLNPLRIDTKRAIFTTDKRRLTAVNNFANSLDATVTLTHVQTLLDDPYFRLAAGELSYAKNKNPEQSLWHHFKICAEELELQIKYFRENFNTPEKLSTALQHDDYYKQLTVDDLNVIYQTVCPDNPELHKVFLEIIVRKRHGRAGNGQAVNINGNSYQQLKAVYIKQQLTTDHALWAAICDDGFYLNLSANDFKQIMAHCNVELFAKLLVEVRGGIGFKSFTVRDNKITYEKLQTFYCAQDHEPDFLNEIRAVVGQEQQIPEGFLPAGASHNGGFRKVALEDKYQLQDSDIAAGESKLKELFAGQLLNRSSETQEVKLKDGINYYLLSCNGIGIFVNHNSYQMQAFKDLLHNFLKSAEQQTQAVILCGLVNTNSNHYIPYFVHLSADKHVSVLTLDPSAQKHKKVHFGKLQAITIVKNAFEYMLGDEYTVHFQDPNVTQMLKEYDCGYLSLQTIYDVLSTNDTEQPLLTIHEGSLQLDLDQLRINGNKGRVYDYRRRRFCYSPAVQEQALAVRHMWAAHLRHVTDVKSIFIDQEQGLNAVEVPVESVDYDYAANVKNQDERDTLANAMSTLRVHFDRVTHNGAQRIFNKYIQTLELPETSYLDNVAEQIRISLNRKVATAVERGEQLAVDFQLPSEELEEQLDMSIEDGIALLIQRNVKGRFAEALKNVYPRFLRAYSWPKGCDMQQIYDDFIAVPKYKELFDGLELTQQNQLKYAITDKADEAQRLYKRYLDAGFKSLAKANIRPWLFSLTGDFTNLGAAIFVNINDNLPVDLMKRFRREEVVKYLNQMANRYIQTISTQTDLAIKRFIANMDQVSFAELFAINNLGLPAILQQATQNSGALSTTELETEFGKHLMASLEGNVVVAVNNAVCAKLQVIIASKATMQVMGNELRQLGLSAVVEVRDAAYASFVALIAPKIPDLKELNWSDPEIKQTTETVIIDVFNDVCTTFLKEHYKEKLDEILSSICLEMPEQMALFRDGQEPQHAIALVSKLVAAEVQAKLRNLGNDDSIFSEDQTSEYQTSEEQESEEQDDDELPQVFFEIATAAAVDSFKSRVAVADVFTAMVSSLAKKIENFNVKISAAEQDRIACDLGSFDLEAQNILLQRYVDTDEFYEELRNQVFTKVINFAKTLFKLYKPGDMAPTSLAMIIRPFLYELCSVKYGFIIKDRIPLTEKLAKLIDQKIVERFESLEQVTELFQETYPCIPLPYTDGKTIPLAYSEATPELLHQCHQLLQAQYLKLKYNLARFAESEIARFQAARIFALAQCIPDKYAGKTLKKSPEIRKLILSFVNEFFGSEDLLENIVKQDPFTMVAIALAHTDVYLEFLEQERSSLLYRNSQRYNANLILSLYVTPKIKAINAEKTSLARLKQFSQSKNTDHANIKFRVLHEYVLSLKVLGTESLTDLTSLELKGKVLTLNDFIVVLHRAYLLIQDYPDHELHQTLITKLEAFILQRINVEGFTRDTCKQEITDSDVKEFRASVAELTAKDVYPPYTVNFLLNQLERSASFRECSRAVVSPVVGAVDHAKDLPLQEHSGNEDDMLVEDTTLKV